MTIYQVVIKATLLGSEILRNIHHYEFPDYIPGEAAKQSFVDEFDSNLKTRLQSAFSEEVTVNSYGLRRVDITSQPEDDIVATNGSWSGSDVGALLPTQVAALITWKAFTTYPRSTRTYLFPFTINALSQAGLIGAAELSSMLGYGGDILEIVIPGQANATKQAVKFTGSPPIVLSANPVESVLTNSNWATQRRRRRGVGA